jgi:anti-sigma-K factor RskA
MRYQEPQLCELLAAEYVLGTLKGSAWRRFQGLLHTRPDLRCRVREWEHRLARLGEPGLAVPPPPEVRAALQKHLFPTTTPTRWFDHLAFWRNLALGSSLLAGVLAVLLLITPAPDVAGYVAMINNASQQSVWMISTTADMKRLYVKNMKPMDVPPGKRCILWLQSEDSQTLYSLGTLPEQEEGVTLEVEKDRGVLLPGQLLVTLEDKAGPVPSRPSGPSEFQGQWIPIRSGGKT